MPICLKTAMALVVGPVFAMSAAQLSAQDVPHQFVSGEPAQASQVNDNFQHISDLMEQIEQDLLANSNQLGDQQDEIDDLSTRIDELEVDTVRRRVDIPANAMAIFGDADTFSGGVRIPTSGGSLTVSVPRPVDYAGGDVDFILSFQSLFGDSALFGSFTRARSFNSGEPYSDITGIRFDDVMIEDDQVVYITSAEIPESRMTGEVWYTTIQRAQDDQYNGSVVIYSLSMEYDAHPQGGE